MERYNRITNKNFREIVLLKAKPCAWGKCRFCDYIDDNSEKLSENIFLLLGKSDWMVVTKGNRSLRDRQRSLSATGY